MAHPLLDSAQGTRAGVDEHTAGSRRASPEDQEQRRRRARLTCAPGESGASATPLHGVAIFSDVFRSWPKSVSVCVSRAWPESVSACVCVGLSTCSKHVTLTAGVAQIGFYRFHLADRAKFRHDRDVGRSMMQARFPLWKIFNRGGDEGFARRPGLQNSDMTDPRHATRGDVE